MARKKYVSRTIIGTEAVFMCIDTKANKIVDVTLTFGGEYKDEKAVMKQAEKSGAFAGDIKPAKVNSMKRIEKLYAVTEEQFLSMAVECDPITRKPIGVTDDDIEIFDADTKEVATDKQ